MKILNWFFVALGIFGLIGVRMMENVLFYDPFLNFFHNIEAKAAMPRFNLGKLILSHIFRFLLNLFFSLVVVHFLFKNKLWTLQAAVLIGIVFLITFPVYLYCVMSDFRPGLLFSFYVRRFVIQPLAVLLIVPIFYYRKNLEKL